MRRGEEILSGKERKKKEKKREKERNGTVMPI